MMCHEGDDIQRVQLTLFEDPKELYEKVEAKVWDSMERTAFLGGHKLAEGNNSPNVGWNRYEKQYGKAGLCGDIAAHGVERPIDLYTPQENRYLPRDLHDKVLIGNGHHRTACAASLGVPFVPVTWHGRW